MKSRSTTITIDYNDIVEESYRTIVQKMREKQERESFKFSNFKKTEKFASDGNQWFRVTRDAINGKRKIIAVDKDVPETKSYARVVSEDSRNEKEAKRPTIKERVDNRKWFSVMVVNLPPEASVRDIWLFFNKQRLIKDIILPRKRDIRNNRIGFIIVDNLGLAETLVRNFHQKQMGRWKLMVKISDRKSGKDKMDSSEDKKDTNHSDKKEAAAERANKSKWKSQSNTKSRGIKDYIVEQPLFRTINGTIDEDFKETLSRSLIGVTAGIEWADSLQERIVLQGYNFISVRGISHKVFLLVFDAEVFASNTNIEFLYEFFSSVHKATHADLIVPRIAWLECDGLPISAWNKTTWSNIIGDWGYLLSENRKPLKNSMYTKLRICIATSKVDKIKETVKVQIEGKGFWVCIKESSNLQLEAQDWLRYDSYLGKNGQDRCFDQSSEEDICTPMREDGNIGIMEDDQQNIIGTENDALMGNNIVLEESGTNSQINHPEHLEEVAKEISVNPVRRDLEDRDNLSMNVGVIVSQEVDKVLETPMDVIPGFYVEECVSDRDMDIITGLESSLPEILNNAWCVRDRTSSQSSEQTSVKLLDNSEEELGNDLGVFDSEAVVPPKIIDQVTQLSIGRKRGRPRKYARVYSFADKRKGTNVRRNPPSAKEDLPVNKISVSKKEKRKNIRQSKLKELESLDKENSTAMGTGKDLALQVLETGELLGLIPLEDRELTLSKIRNHIAESDH